MYKEMIIEEMHEVFREIPFGIEHTLKVLENAEAIMEGENIKGEDRDRISITAILHDIGAVQALNKYGSLEGVYQEKEGPAVAREILERAGYAAVWIDRVCFIIANHHTPSKIDGIDFQIQWEADLIENILGTEVKMSKKELFEMIESNFKTATGKAFIYSLALFS